MSVSSLRSLAGRTSCGPRWRSGLGGGRGLHAHRRGRMQARRGFPDAPHTCAGQGAACRRVSWACREVWEEQQD